MFGTMSGMKILRVAPDVEIKGLDIPKHAEPAYPVESWGSGWDDKPFESMYTGGEQQTNIQRRDANRLKRVKSLFSAHSAEQKNGHCISTAAL